MNPFELGFFQFENLIRNQIPFLLLSFEVDLNDFFSPPYQSHLNKVCVNTQESKVEEILRKYEVQFNDAIVLLCEKGKTSLKVHKRLESLGYTNVYMIQGGYTQLVKELILEKKS